MNSQEAYSEITASLAEIKYLFLTRKWNACSSRCAQVMKYAEDSNGQFHPVHLAFLHFYQAMCLDTLAREKSASSPSRLEAITVAEEHYLATISALTQPEKPIACGLIGAHDSFVPTHLSYERVDSATGSRPWSREHSFDSDCSSPVSHATDATSVNGIPLEEMTDCDPQSDSHHKDTGNVTSIYPMEDAATPMEEKIAEFLDRVSFHLASLRKLKNPPAAAPSTFFSGPRASVMIPKARTRESSRDWEENQMVMEKIREDRRNVTFRPLFDPAPIHQLCSQALDECPKSLTAKAHHDFE